VKNKVVGVTGHRPQKLAASPDCFGDKVLKQLIKLALKSLRELEPRQVITGMALGWDFAIAIAALHLEIPIIAAVPFEGQDSKWPEQSRIRYKNILKKITRQGGEIIIVSPGAYSARKMQIRNEFIVDNCNLLLALWDGKNSGGTYNAVNYAQESAGITVVNVWDDWMGR
jgi:uncharacterized phage-like protein YoqJ